MPPIVNPRNERVRADQIIARGREFREDGPPLPAPGMPRGYVKMLMEERAARMRPGMPQRSRLTWKRCQPLQFLGDEPCKFNGEPVLICGRCWDDRKVFIGLTIIGPLTAPMSIECQTCGGQDTEVQADTGIPTGYTEAMGRIADWNSTIERRIERRKQCDTPFGWLPLWHPGAW